MIDLVLGAAIGYSAEQVRPFLRSLRESGYAGRVILFADQGGAEEARKWDVEVLPCRPVNGKPHATRFIWLQEALEGAQCSGVLLSDTRDVIFQGDLSMLPAQGLHAFEEDRSVTLASCPYNSEWLRLGYGETVLGELGELPVSCVGTVCGDRASVQKYLQRLREEIERIQPRTNKPQDQAAHNYLIRKELPATIWNNENGQVYTVGYLPRESVVMAAGKVLNKAGDAPTVIHQWDRHRNLSAFVKRLFLMDYVVVAHDGKPVYGGHGVGSTAKAEKFKYMLAEVGWCFLPVPVVDLGAYYQAVDGTHRLEGARLAGVRPELAVLDARLHPDQPLPEGWKQVVEAPLSHGRTIRGFRTSAAGYAPRDHIGVVLDDTRDILPVEAVRGLFDALLRLAQDKPVDMKVQKYIAKAVKFSESGELYQSIPDGSVGATRNTKARWEAYGITGLEGRDVLDVGCNIGGFSAFCAPVCKSYRGIDVDPDSIALAQHIYKFPNCSFGVAPVQDAPKASWDVVLAFAVRYYTRMQVPAWAELMASLLRPGGVLYYESHAREKMEDQREAFAPFFTVARVVSVPVTDARADRRFFAEMRRK